MEDAEVKNHLTKTDPTFRELFQLHQDYEKQLDELLHKSFLSSEEQIHETELKKKKLALKDQMQVMINEYQGQVS